MSIVAICLSISLAVLSVLFPVSYMKSFRKEEWISNFDAEEAKLMEDYPNQGRTIYVYTFLGAILRTVGLAGIVNVVMLITAEPIWIYFVENMTLGFVWIFFFNRFGLSAFIGIMVGIWYFRSIRDRIRTWI